MSGPRVISSISIPPDRVAGQPLRFPVGTRVEVCYDSEESAVSVSRCENGSWVPATVVAQDYSQSGWCPGVVAAYLVRLEVGDYDSLPVREDDERCIRPTFEKGSRVEMVGLQVRKDLNGRTGTVVKFIPSKGRYRVKLFDADDEFILVKRSNLKLKDADAQARPLARTAGDGAGDATWRAKSIAQFGLREVPDGWRDAVAEASDDAWKRYYRVRRGAVEKRRRASDMGMEGDDEVLDRWESEMERRVEGAMADGCEWHWTPGLGELVWDDCGSLRSAEYYSLVWSPYAIPRAMRLEHRYHLRTRWSSIEFFTVWSYRLIDFGDKATIKGDEYTTICSNCYEDEELRADVIEQSHMNRTTCYTLRKFLFGSSSEESKAVTCSDMDFWLLLFGSMGTTDADLAKDPYGGDHGYEWRPNREERKMLYDLKAEEGNGREGDPNGPFEEYYPSGCSWLKHRLLEITGNLGPVTRHYRPPTIKDAGGYWEDSDDDDW